MIKKCSLLSLIPLFLSLPTIQADDEDYHLGFRIAPRVSTLGGGLEVAQGLTSLVWSKGRRQLLHMEL